MTYIKASLSIVKKSQTIPKNHKTREREREREREFLRCEISFFFFFFWGGWGGGGGKGGREYLICEVRASGDV